MAHHYHYSRADLLHFLEVFRYHFPPSYQGGTEYYYNPATRGEIGILTGQQKFTEEEVRVLFSARGAGLIDQDPELSFLIFKAFMAQEASIRPSPYRGTELYFAWKKAMIGWMQTLSSFARIALAEWLHNFTD